MFRCRGARLDPAVRIIEATSRGEINPGQEANKGAIG